MKLNVDILYDALSSSFTVRRMGSGKKELCLGRPEFYDGRSNTFQADRLYICLTEQLPSKPVLEGGAALICVGGRPGTGYTAGHPQVCCIWLTESTDLFSLFNRIQQIFDRYDAWSARMQQILTTTASMQELIDCCFPIFENPLLVMDRDFHILAYSEIIDQQERLAFMRPDTDNKYAHSLVSESLLNTAYNRAQQKAFNVTDPLRNVTHFSTNLYANEKFVGNLKISFILRPHRESDNALACYLARVVEKAFLFNPRLMDSCVNPLCGILRDLLNGVPIELSRKQHRFSGSMEGNFLCAKIVPSSLTSSKVTSSYILQHIETTFPGSNAFETDGYLVVLIDLGGENADEKVTLHTLRKLLKEMGLQAGVSCPFQNLLAVRLYFRQAVLALELGAAKDPNHCCHYFSDYKLSYMCMSSLGEFSAENLMAPGLARLVRHDAASQTNYVQTLRIYLKNNMNSSKAAQELYIHRSTFQERLQRIETILDLDLEDPGKRLYLMLMLRILEEQSGEAPIAASLSRLAESPEPTSHSFVRILNEY